MKILYTLILMTLFPLVAGEDFTLDPKEWSLLQRTEAAAALDVDPHTIPPQDGRTILDILPRELIGYSLYFLDKKSMKQVCLSSQGFRASFHACGGTLHDQNPKAIFYNILNLLSSRSLNLHPSKKNVETLWLYDRLLRCGEASTLIRDFPSVTKILFTHCSEHLSDECLITLATAYPGLTTLDVPSAVSLTPHSIETIATTCKHLETLELKDCTGLNNQAMLAIAENCPDLRTLVATSWTLDDDALRALARGRTKLEDLDLSYNKGHRFSKQALTELIEACPNLDTLLLLGHTTVSAADLFELSDKHERVVILGEFLP